MINRLIAVRRHAFTARALRGRPPGLLEQPGSGRKSASHQVNLPFHEVKEAAIRPGDFTHDWLVTKLLADLADG